MASLVTIKLLERAPFLAGQGRRGGDRQKNRIGLMARAGICPRGHKRGECCIATPAVFCQEEFLFDDIQPAQSAIPGGTG